MAVKGAQNKHDSLEHGMYVTLDDDERKPTVQYDLPPYMFPGRSNSEGVYVALICTNNLLRCWRIGLTRHQAS